MSIRPPRRAVVSMFVVLAVGCTRSSSGGATAGGTSAPSSSATGTSTPGGSTFTGHGVSFDYPRGWRAFGETDTSASMGTQVWSQTVGIDGRNIVTVAQYTLAVSITRDNIAARTGDIRSELANLFTQAGGSLTSGPTSLEMAGLPALSFTGQAKRTTGDPVEDRVILAFDGTTEYFVNCQHDRRGASKIKAGCDGVVSTFRLTG